MLGAGDRLQVTYEANWKMTPGFPFMKFIKMIQKFASHKYTIKDKKNPLKILRAWDGILVYNAKTVWI